MNQTQCSCPHTAWMFCTGYSHSVLANCHLNKAPGVAGSTKVLIVAEHIMGKDEHKTYFFWWCSSTCLQNISHVLSNCWNKLNRQNVKQKKKWLSHLKLTCCPNCLVTTCILWSISSAVFCIVLFTNSFSFNPIPFSCSSQSKNSCSPSSSMMPTGLVSPISSDRSSGGESLSRIVCMLLRMVHSWTVAMSFPSVLKHWSAFLYTSTT